MPVAAATTTVSSKHHFSLFITTPYFLLLSLSLSHTLCKRHFSDHTLHKFTNQDSKKHCCSNLIGFRSNTLWFFIHFHIKPIKANTISPTYWYSKKPIGVQRNPLKETHYTSQAFHQKKPCWCSNKPIKGFASKDIQTTRRHYKSPEN
ncbi:hypothetical protein Hanom_Chr04g00306261 [Helianthus anomalus]